jgi:Nucleotidyltransferase of unknown function (DUF6036)
MFSKPEHVLALPWSAFLDEVDHAISEPVELHCIGGFVVSLLYGLPPPTGDTDYIAAIPGHRIGQLERLAGRGSKLHDKYKVHLQYVTVASIAEDYEARLKEMFPARFKKLKILAPDPYDLVLSKLEPNSPKDQDDVEYLAKTVPLDSKILRDRYERELRPNLMARQNWHDGALTMWIGAYFPTPAENGESR